MLSVLMSLLYMAGSMLLMREVELRDYKKLNQNPTARDIQKIANLIMSRAQNKGSSLANTVAEKIADITAPYGISSTANRYLNEQKDRLRKKQSEIKALNDDISESISAAQGSVNAHEMLTNQGKNSAIGEQIRGQVDQQLRKVQDQTQKLDQIEKQL